MLKHFANRQVPNIVNKEHIFFAYTALLCFVLTVPFSGRTSQPLRVQWEGGGFNRGGDLCREGGRYWGKNEILSHKSAEQRLNLSRS